MYVIGLTGNIATGKSTVANFLGELGATVIDADKLAHDLMRAGTAVHRRIVARFPTVQDSNGEIDRQRLGEIVFSDADALADLEAIVHPGVVKAARKRLEHSNAPVAVIEAIKLLEAEMHQDCDAVWVVTAPRAEQIARLVENRGLTRQAAEQRIDAQSPQEQKIARADVVIDNGGELAETRRQVLAAWQRIPEQQDASGISGEGQP